MPKFRPMRQRRKQNLLNLHFTGAEAQAFSKIPPTSVPYMRFIIRQRQNELRGLRTGAQRAAKIVDLYLQNHWTSIGKSGFGKGQQILDPWKMFRYYEDLYKRQNPSYTSGYEKRRMRLISPYNEGLKRR